MTTSQPTLDDVWLLFKETDRLFKEMNKKSGDLGNRLGEIGMFLNGYDSFFIFCSDENR